LPVNSKGLIAKLVGYNEAESSVVSVDVKKEVAKRHADLLKSMPDGCGSGRKSVWGFLTSWLWSQNAECVRHFESVEIDPLWEVPPTKVLDCFLCTFVVIFCQL